MLIRKGDQVIPVGNNSKFVTRMCQEQPCIWIQTCIQVLIVINYKRLLRNSLIFVIKLNRKPHEVGLNRVCCLKLGLINDVCYFLLSYMYLTVILSGHCYCQPYYRIFYHTFLTVFLGKTFNVRIRWKPQSSFTKRPRHSFRSSPGKRALQYKFPM